MRIDKLLANMNIGSRKEVKKYIKDGLVRVNGRVVDKPTSKVDPDLDKICLEDIELVYKEYVYLMMNKPAGLISATEGYSQRTVLDLLEDSYQKRDIFPAGRLDKDTEGLVFLTNDGRLAHNLLSPKKKVWKKYFARLDKDLERDDIKSFSEGVFIKEDSYLSQPAKLEILNPREAYVYLTEGKYHQVKRMFSNLGKNVVYLKRLEIGSLILDDTLGLGQYRPLTEDELKNLQDLTSANN